MLHQFIRPWSLSAKATSVLFMSSRCLSVFLSSLMNARTYELVPRRLVCTFPGSVLFLALASFLLYWPLPRSCSLSIACLYRFIKPRRRQIGKSLRLLNQSYGFLLCFPHSASIWNIGCFWLAGYNERSRDLSFFTFALLALVISSLFIGLSCAARCIVYTGAIEGKSVKVLV